LSEVVTPEWVKHAVFYQIFPDRFAKSPTLSKPDNLEPWDADPSPLGYKGGDLAGVTERLDYLQDLGVTAIYFNPIFQSAANHRYHTHDYYQIDPLLGGDGAFREMLATCKARGIRVVLDGVFNHASRGFFQFNDILENGAASAWRDWFTVTAYPPNAYDMSRPPDYAAWFGLHALPKLNTDNPRVREFLMRVGEHWVRRGVDGWRLDVPNEISSTGFWAEFRSRIKAVNPDAYIVGEIWDEAQPWLRGDQFDAVMNYRFAEAAIAFVAGPRVRPEMVASRGYRPYPPLDAAGYADRVDRLLGLYPWPVELAQLNLLDSHDTARLLSVAGGDEASLRLGVLLLLTFPGAPCIYYGDEIGLDGGPSDALARRTFPWDRPASWNHGLRAYYKEAIALRHAQPALRTGSYRRLLATGDTYAFARGQDGATLVVALNVGTDDHLLQIPLDGLAAGHITPRLLFGSTADAQAGEGQLLVTLPARSGIVLDVSGQAA